MILYGVAGTNGSGKDMLGEYLAEQHGFMFLSVTDMLRKEAKKRGWPVERENLRTISAEWRREHGLGVLVVKTLEHYESAGGDTNYKGLVMASMRNHGEADKIHDLGGKMIWLDADPEVRYNRIFTRQRTGEDNKTYEQFIAEEQAEMVSTGDAATLDMGKVKDRCDIFISNNSNDPNQFHSEIKKSLKL